MRMAQLNRQRLRDWRVGSPLGAPCIRYEERAWAENRTEEKGGVKSRTIHRENAYQIQLLKVSQITILGNSRK